MADYDYKAGKRRLEEILDNDMEVVEQDKLPNDDDFTFTNGYYSWVSANFSKIIIVSQNLNNL